jgi:tRNA pseudouridine55 synthase
MTRSTHHSSPVSPDLLHGFVVIDKPAGWTSHDVVARIRRLTGLRRVGHAGTLDPMATGVLPLALGQATKLLEYLSEADKGYRATVRLGLTTDTDDATGAPLVERPWQHVTEEAVRRALAEFVGTVQQVPPAYSAIKRSGVPLYRLARRGQQVTAPPRTVTIHRIDVLAVALPDVTFEVACSKGTYIRSLARDLGDRLGTGGHLRALRRLWTGPFDLRSAHTLDEVAQAAGSGALPSLILPPDTVLPTAPALVLGPRGERRLVTGQALGIAAAHPSGTVGRAYSVDGAVLGVVQVVHGEWRPHKVLSGPG